MDVMPPRKKAIVDIDLSRGDKPPRYTPSEVVGMREVDMDLTFRRANQFAEWMMDRMEAEIDHADGSIGLPARFPGYLRELSSCLNTLSLSHARWLKANEELYERLSDDQKMEALGKWMAALFTRQPQKVRDWMKQLAVDCKNSGGPGTPTPGAHPAGPVAEMVGGGLVPTYKEVAAQVRADFEKKRQALYGPRKTAGKQYEKGGDGARKAWNRRNRVEPEPENAEGEAGNE